MNRFVLSFAYFFLIALSAESAVASEIGVVEINCTRADNGATECLLKWDISTRPNAYYRVQRLDEYELDWVNYTEQATVDPIGSMRVEEQSLYRVVGCASQQSELSCRSSTAAWANTLRPVEEIPPEMESFDGRGNSVVVGISKNESAYVQLSQYNVYLLTNLFVKVALFDDSRLPQMSPLIEPADAHQNLDHQISHNTHDMYMRSKKALDARSGQ